MTNVNTWINVLVGAAITLGLSFTGFSPLLGGGVAGYLQGGPSKLGAKVGAISGVCATIPLLIIVIVGIGMFAAVPGTGVRTAIGGLELLLILGMIVPMFLLWFVGLSAA